MFNVSALLLDDELKPTTPLTNGAISETLRQFAPLSDDRLLQLIDCRESSTLIDHLLKGTSNSVIDWIQVRAVWGPDVRLDERDVLTPQVRQCTCSLQCVNGEELASSSSSRQPKSTANITADLFSVAVYYQTSVKDVSVIRGRCSRTARRHALQVASRF